MGFAQTERRAIDFPAPGMEERDIGYYSMESIGELYDAVRPYRERADVGFYVDEARNAGGKVLEAGCGTGRVLIPIAREGIAITGIDQSSQMLDRCRSSIAREPDDVRGRITLHQADMREFDIGETFALAIIPFRPFQHLLEVGEQVSTLRCIHDHLDPGGRLVFDVFHADFGILAAGSMPEKEDTPETLLPDGRRFRRTGAVTAVHRARQVSDVEMAYYVTDADGGTERLIQRFSMRWFSRFEIEHLLARTGYSVEAVYGNFDRSALTDESPEMIFVAERR